MDTENNFQKCFFCQAENKLDEDYCVNCGSKLKHKIRNDIIKKKNEQPKISKTTLAAILVLIIVATPISTLFIRSRIYNGVVQISNWSLNEEMNEITIVFRCSNGSSILKYFAIGGSDGLILHEVKYDLKMESSHAYTITESFPTSIISKFVIYWDCYTYGPDSRTYSLTS